MADSVKWYEKSGNDGDVVCSTRVRLARNLTQYPFPNRMNRVQKEEVREKVKDALLYENNVLTSSFSFVNMEELSDKEAVAYVERHLVSPEFISDRAGKAILVSVDESVSIMINEEDHIRIQVMKEGLSLKQAAETADKLDTFLGENLKFAFDSRFGFLTQCPTNLGTGMRASVMMHLIALTESGAMTRISDNLSKLGLTLRGTYGENSKVLGDMYQLSNQLTLGLSEQEAIRNLDTVSVQLMDEERKRREELIKNLVVQDKIDRAAGVLKSAKILSDSEFLEMLSYVRFGISVGLLKGLSAEDLNSLEFRVRPASLMMSSGEKHDKNELDALRASITREICKSLKE